MTNIFGVELRNPRVLIAVPTYNESESIDELCRRLASTMPEADILIIDDNSPDGTGEIADRLAAADPRVEVLHRPGKEGLGPAYIAGFHRALEGGAALVVQMDADFSHDPAYLPRLIAASVMADLVVGSRYVPGGGITEWGEARRMISRGGSFYSRVVLGVPVRDLTGGFKCFRREVLETVDLDTVNASGYSFQVEMTYRVLKAGFEVLEVPITFRERRAGSSKMSTSIMLEAAWRVPAIRLSTIGRRRRSN